MIYSQKSYFLPVPGKGCEKRSEYRDNLKRNRGHKIFISSNDYIDLG